MAMQHLATHHVQSVAVLSPNTTYGKTFYDWISFWAIETGVNLTECLEYSGENETSKSAIYDSQILNWISDEFTSKLIDIIRKSDDEISVCDLYEETYRAVRSSHPGIINNNNSFSMNTPIMEFFGKNGSITDN